MNMPIRRRVGHDAVTNVDPRPASKASDARALALTDVDRWLTSLAEQLDEHVELLTQIEEVLPVVRRLARDGGADELSVRRGERTLAEGLEQLAALGVALRRGTVVCLGPRSDRAGVEGGQPC